MSGETCKYGCEMSERQRYEARNHSHPGICCSCSGFEFIAKLNGKVFNGPKLEEPENEFGPVTP